MTGLFSQMQYESAIRLALYQPDIPQNAGTLLRLGACLGIGVDIIEPCGFVFDERKMRRAGMDYLERADYVRHGSWEAFLDGLRDQGRRLVLLSTKASDRLDHFSFCPQDTIMVGRESAGVPDMVAAAADHRLRIPMAMGARSINVALAAAMVVGEALRQTGGFPGEQA
jgi:tRNA (cytidine/uridine-2'-O-)-methyltransferase